MWQLLHFPVHRFFDLNSSMSKRQTGGAIQLNHRLLVGRHRGHKIRLRLRQIAVRLQNQIAGRGAESFLLLFDVEGLPGEITGFPGRIHPLPVLQLRELGITNFDADLILQLLQVQLGLTVLQLRAYLVGLGPPVT